MSENNDEADFSAIIASSVHDMKNSLCMLLGALDEIMSRYESENNSLEEFSHIRYEGNRVNNSLIQLLSLYRIGNGQYSLNLSENDVEECIEECFLESEGLLALKGIDSHMNCDDELLWYFDRNLIIGMLNSVINNSYKYTKSVVNLHAYSEDGYLVIAVEDDGAGYPDAMLHEDKEHVPGIDYKSGSTGLGLYFAGQIAHMHENRGRRGFIKTNNDGVNGGGKFAIYLP